MLPCVDVEERCQYEVELAALSRPAHEPVEGFSETNIGYL